LVRKDEDRAKKHGANATALNVVVNRKSGEAEHWQWVVRKALGLRERKILYFNL